MYCTRVSNYFCNVTTKPILDTTAKSISLCIFRHTQTHTHTASSLSLTMAKVTGKHTNRQTYYPLPPPLAGYVSVLPSLSRWSSSPFLSWIVSRIWRRQPWDRQYDWHLECPGGCRSWGMGHQFVPEGGGGGGGEVGSHGVVSATVTHSVTEDVEAEAWGTSFTWGGRGGVGSHGVISTTVT